MPKLGILISGRGSNMMALHRHIQQGVLNAEIAVVISNKPTAGGLEYAKGMALMPRCLNPRHLTLPLIMKQLLWPSCEQIMLILWCWRDT